MPEVFPLTAGDTGTLAMLSLCAGGLLRTWTDSGPARLWSVADADHLHAVLGTGTIARTVREEHRFREVAFLSEETGTLMIQSRFPTQTDDGTLQFEGSVIRLAPAGEATESVFEDVRSLLTQAISHALANNEYLLVEKGGWDARQNRSACSSSFPRVRGSSASSSRRPHPTTRRSGVPTSLPAGKARH